VALLVVSGRRVIKALIKAGFRVEGRKGSHVKLKKADGKVFVVIVPDHAELAKGTLNST
jgi:predicted RNA binding protein YcfA (HicA-like mRNA interferase family)